MNIKQFLASFITVVIFGFMISCGTTGSLEKADKAFELYQFHTAVEIYKDIFPKEKDRKIKREIAFKTGECYRQMNQYKRAKSQYQKAIKLKYQDPIAIYWLAEMMKRLEEYDDAKKQFETYIREIPGDPFGVEGVRMCDSAIKWQDDQTRYVVEVFKVLNSKANDFAPMFYKKGAMIVTSDREEGIGRNMYQWTGLNHTDIFLSEMSRSRKNKKLQKPVLLEEDVINTNFNDGTVTFNRRMSVIYYTQCNDSKGKGHNCRILTSRKKGQGWSEPKVLEFCSDSFVKYGHPSLSADEKKLYFISNMEGGYGGHDIYVSTFVRRGKTWGDPANLGSTINTTKNEMFPFIYYDNKTLYFSSDGHPGIGGLDVFKSVKDEERNWSEPENLKSPINSGGDDFSIIVEKGGNRTRGYSGYFASNRPGSRGDDIYKFHMIPLKFTLSGIVFNLKTNEIIPDATVTMRINDTSSIEVQTDNSGGYHYELGHESDYAIDATKKFYFDSEVKTCSTKGLEFSQDFIRDLYLDPFITTEIELEGIYYDLDKYDLRQESMDVLDSLYSILTNHPYIVIELASHTDCRATYDYNIELSNNRAQAVVDYLIYKGIPIDRMEPKGYGETELVNECACEDRQGAGVDCSDDEHQQNRRTTFKILRTDYIYTGSQYDDPDRDERPRKDTIDIPDDDY